MGQANIYIQRIVESHTMYCNMTSGTKGERKREHEMKTRPDEESVYCWGRVCE
jgi:hypothetical protein